MERETPEQCWDRWCREARAAWGICPKCSGHGSVSSSYDVTVLSGKSYVTNIKVILCSECQGSGHV